MAIDITTPQYPWLSAYQDITFGFDTPMVNPSLASVTSVGGKARFNVNISGPVAGCKCKRIYVPSGIYKGFHTVTAVTYVTSPAMLGGIYYETTTDYIGTATGSFYCMPNITYRVWYGYPNQDKSIDIKVIYRPDASMHVNLSTFLRNTFTISPPVPGVDTSMFTHFKVEVIGDDDFNQYLTDFGYTVNSLTGYNWTTAANKWYVLNGTKPHDELNANHVGAGKYLSEQKPILFWNHCVIYSIIYGINQDQVYNVISCTGPAVLEGIGYWAIGDDFEVS